MNVEELINDPSFNDVQKSPSAKKKSDITKRTFEYEYQI